MNINKKLDRVKQWAGEKMGADVKTNVSDEFKALELEMALRQDGMGSIDCNIALYATNICQVWKSYTSPPPPTSNPSRSATILKTRRKCYQLHTWARL